MYNVIVLDPITNSIIELKFESMEEVQKTLQGHFCKGSTAMNMLIVCREKIAHVSNLNTCEAFWLYDVVI